MDGKWWEFSAIKSRETLHRFLRDVCGTVLEYTMYVAAFHYSLCSMHEPTPPPPCNLPAFVRPVPPRGGGVWHKASVSDCLPLAAPIGLSHGGGRQPMCDPRGVRQFGGLQRGGGGASLTQTQHLFRQAPSKRANTQS